MYDTSVNRPVLTVGPGSPSGLDAGAELQAVGLSPPSQYDR